MKHMPRYLLGVVDSIDPSKDHMVRSCRVAYTIPNSKDPIGIYNGGKRIIVSRSIQRLTLILQIEDQCGSMVVENNTVKKSI